ncbi:MAG: NAD(P)H-dependent oxidoreductase [Nitrospinota bacterium]
MPNIVVISGSRRAENNTEKALRIALDELQGSASVEVVRVGEWSFPLPGDTEGADDGERLRELALAADALLFATPEYHGSISSTLKLIIDNLGFPSTLEGKTIAILGVAMGPSADNAVGHLRHILTHIGGSVLPREASVGNVHKVFDESGACLDPEVEASIRAVARGLLDCLK